MIGCVWCRLRCAGKRGRCPWRGISFVIILLGVLFLLQVVGTHARKGSGGHGVRLSPRPEWHRRRSKNSECHLGAHRYALHSTWSPDLGPPFGVWSCVQCSCKPVRKKRRVVAKVMCRNVKTECPKADCKNPVLLPGACCKVCTNTNAPHTGFLQKTVEHMPENEENKDFAVLLNGRTSPSPLTTAALSTGRIFLRRGTLHYSFVLGEHTPSPATVEFRTADGDALEELEVQSTPYEVTNNRVCGTWTRVPREYRKLLRKEQLWVALIPDEGGDAISGRIVHYKGVDTEIFSALLSPLSASNQSLPGGGTAIISVSMPSDSLHISLVFNGVFKKEDHKNATLVIELVPSRALQPVKDVTFMEKVYMDINEAQIMTTLGETSLRLLTRGKVSLRVYSPNAPELGVEGLVMARATCNVYSTVLTSSLSQVTSAKKQHYVHGWGLLFVLNEGDFEYQMQLVGLNFSPVVSVTLESNYRKKNRLVEDLTSQYTGGQWVNGTYGKPTFRDLETLLRGKLSARVKLGDGSELRGIFEYVSITEALNSMHPILLRSDNFWMAATAWVAVDSACVMHYDIFVGGEAPAGEIDPTWQLLLRENDTTWDPRLDQQNVTLEELVTGREVAAHTTRLTRISLSRLKAEVTYLDLVVSKTPKVFESLAILTGDVKGVDVPMHCLLESLTDSKIPKSKDKKGNGYSCSGFGCLDQAKKPIITTKCIDDAKKVYNNGASWPSPVTPCQRCMCITGRIRCQEEPCPALPCVTPVALPGQCCKSCPVPTLTGTVSERVCTMDNADYSIGSYWHPFLPPNGFDKCITCYCNVSSTGQPVVEYQRMRCPPLPCRVSEAEIVKDSCCRQCPKNVIKPEPSIALNTIKSHRQVGIEGMLNSGQLSPQQIREDVLRKGGCLEREKILRENGESWHPKIYPRGKSLCIACACKDSRIYCKRNTCVSPDCSTAIDLECCSKCKNKRKQEKKRKKKKKQKQNMLKLRKDRLGYSSYTLWKERKEQEKLRLRKERMRKAKDSMMSKAG